MKGIQRINITDKTTGRGGWRFDVSKPFYSYIHQVYRAIFPLLPQAEFVNCTSKERYARYDIDFGVDVILNFVNGQSATIQEKVLTTKYSTVTVEYYQNPATEEPGDWFKLKCDFYFVGYGQRGRTELDRWIILDWNQVRLHSASIPWQIRSNSQDGARANFRYAHFDSFPSSCVVAKKMHGDPSFNIAKPESFGDLQLPLFERFS